MVINLIFFLKNMINTSKQYIAIYLVLVSLIIIIAATWFIIAKYQINSLTYNTQRLIATGVARERLYWRCLDEHNQQREGEWRQSESYKKEQSAYNDCENKTRLKSIGQNWYERLFICKGPVEPREEWNNLSSPECSKIADESEAGISMKEFRKKVPINALTND